jgi:hypothetical protein
MQLLRELARCNAAKNFREGMTLTQMELLPSKRWCTATASHPLR